MVSKLVTDSIEASASTSDLSLQSGASGKVKFKAGASGTQFTLPTSDGSNGDKLQTDGSGNLTFAPVAEQVFQNTLINNVTDVGTTYKGCRLIKVLDYHNNLPPSNLQIIYDSGSAAGSPAPTGFSVPTSMASSPEKITRFLLKFHNLNWAYNSSTNETQDIRLDMFVKPKDGAQGSLMSSGTSYESWEHYVYLDSNSSWTHSNQNTTSGANGQYTISGAYNNYLKRSQVGYRFIRNSSTSMFYAMEGGSRGSRPVQGVTYPFREASAKNNLMRSNFSGELEIFNRKDGWDLFGDFTYQRPNGAYNNGYLCRAYTKHFPYYSSTSTYYASNTDHARGLDLYMIPYDFSQANNGSNGSNGQIEANSFGLSGGRIELWADISE